MDEKYLRRKLAETDEFLLFTENGLVKARGVKCLSGAEAWNAACLKLCQSSPRGKAEEGAVRLCKKDCRESFTGAEDSDLFSATT